MKPNLNDLSQHQTIVKGGLSLKTSTFFNNICQPETTKNKVNTSVSHFQIKPNIPNKPNQLKMSKNLKTSYVSPIYSPQKYLIILDDKKLFFSLSPNIFIKSKVNSQENSQELNNSFNKSHAHFLKF